MISETQVTLTQSELTSILILATEFLRRDKAGIHQNDTYRTEHTRQIWLNNCNSIVMKADQALNYCIVADEIIPTI